MLQEGVFEQQRPFLARGSDEKAGGVTRHVPTRPRGVSRKGPRLSTATYTRVYGRTAVSSKPVYIGLFSVSIFVYYRTYLSELGSCMQVR